MGGVVSARWVILDACSLINFYASGFFESVLGDFKTQACIVEHVRNESLFVRESSDVSSRYDYEPIVLDTYFENHELELLKLETEAEKNLFVHYAQYLDDGEAATIALALARGMDVITDDRKATQILHHEAPDVKVLTTLEIIKAWSENPSLNQVDLKRALENIRQRAHYFPGKDHTLFQWWLSHILLDN